MKKALFMLALLAHTEARADLKYIPKWTYDPAKQQACYGFDDAKKLLLIDTQLSLCMGQSDALNTAVAELQKSNVQYKLALDTANKQLDDSKTYEKDLESKLKKSTEERERLAAQARWAWTGVGAVTLVGAAIAFGVWIDRR